MLLTSPTLLSLGTACTRYEHGCHSPNSTVGPSWATRPANTSIHAQSEGRERAGLQRQMRLLCRAGPEQLSESTPCRDTLGSALLLCSLVKHHGLNPRWSAMHVLHASKHAQLRCEADEFSAGDITSLAEKRVRISSHLSGTR